MIQLETYKGTRTRHTCPACNQKNQFTRFVDDAGNYIADDVGICNRSSKCGYRYTAKQYYADHPTGSKFVKTHAKKRSNSNYGFVDNKQPYGNFHKVSQPDYIPFEQFKTTLDNYDRNAFVQFLLNLFPDCSEEIQAVLKMYFVGTFDDYTCFPSIDRLNRVCRAKLIKFNAETGKRLKGDYDTSSLVRKLKLKEDFQYKQIFFGEHLLPKYPNKPVAVVEAEKTAIIASLCFPEFVWLSCNSKTWLKAERLKRLGKRQIILYPDADGFDIWQSIAADAQIQGLTVKVSSLIETHATDEQKANGYDLADYLINQQSEINETNEKLELVLNDEFLFGELETIQNERISIIEFDGNLSRIEAERAANTPENIRQIILSL
jgi:hypothetical protein